MPIMARLALSAPFVLVVIQYVSFLFFVAGNPEIDGFWKNHGLRETMFAVALAGVALSVIWSPKVTQTKLVLVAVVGAPLVIGFWLAAAAVGFTNAGNVRADYVFHAAELVLFIIAFLIVATRS
jgi:4-hydroxybenzoate polyprenyltransferase